MRQGSVQTQAKKNEIRDKKTTKRSQCPSGKLSRTTPEEVPHVPHLFDLTSTFFKGWLPEDVQACQSKKTFRNGDTFGRDDCRVLLAFSLGLVTHRDGMRSVDWCFTGAERSFVLALSFLPGHGAGEGSLTGGCIACIGAPFG